MITVVTDIGDEKNKAQIFGAACQWEVKPSVTVPKK